MDNETLLPIYREFTDKEKLGLSIDREKALIKQVNLLITECTRLSTENKKLKEEINEWEADLLEPHNMKGVKTVNGKTYRKLAKAFRSMTVNFWRVNDELRELKKKISEEKL